VLLLTRYEYHPTLLSLTEPTRAETYPLGQRVDIMFELSGRKGAGEVFDKKEMGKDVDLKVNTICSVSQSATKCRTLP
jgi:hypothetical protein